MVDIDSSKIDPLFRQFGPSDEVKKSFHDSLIGSLAGQAFLLLGLIASYVAIVALIHSWFGASLKALKEDFGPVWFWLLLTAPLAAILIFTGLPTAWRAWRERRLRAMAIAGDPKPGYFRLQPYGDADRADYKRLDGADAKILNWLKSTRTSLLYLSGASGVGKSSVLAAGILPALREAGWNIIETRTYGNAAERLRKAVTDAGKLSRRRSADDLPLATLLRNAAEANAKSSSGPLLLVIDQFEEFLILEDEGGREEFISLLSDIAKNPIEGLKIVLVFRSDYRPLVFKLDLPPLVSNQNWYELGPYGRREAIAFLQGGGRELSAEMTNALFRGLDGVEGTRGIYKPITLNMIGLVLQNADGLLREDPSKLIQIYLTRSLTTGTSRDFVKPLLMEMISDAGTKVPRSESELAHRTGFALWQVQATLADLAERGLTRRLEGSATTWEIAHDFLARMLGQLIGRLRPGVVARMRPLVAPVVLTGWLVAFVVALPAWMVHRKDAAQEVLRNEFRAVIGATSNGELQVQLPRTASPRLADAIPFLRRLDRLALEIGNIDSLDRLMGGASGISSLEPLKDLTNLSSLSLYGGVRPCGWTDWD